MADRALNLDDFLSRFQLLRPQPSRHALNQRQAAVLVPIVRRPQPGLLRTSLRAVALWALCSAGPFCPAVPGFPVEGPGSIPWP